MINKRERSSVDIFHGRRELFELIERLCSDLILKELWDSVYDKL